jgi:pantoate--beta-alanine ligase
VKVAETVADCRAALAPARRAGRRIGFVPTMGFLHEGHLTLVDRARAEADLVVLSVFVNPIQFGPHEDYARYPRDLPRDLALAEGRGVDLVFTPSVEEMFPEPTFTRVTMRIATERYEGAARPGHFDGVLTVVAKLFHIVQPDVAVFGQKDAQQAAVVRRMAQDLAFPIEVVVAPTVREPDGLAFSSRNVYLSAEERAEALAISRAVAKAAELARGGERDGGALERAMRAELDRSPSLQVEYAAVVDADRFTPVARIAGPAVAVIAARVGRTRLIDNAPLDGGSAR